jgi:hypothetical protein
MSTIKATIFTPPSNQPPSKIPSPKPSSSLPDTKKVPIDPPYDSKTATREAASGISQTYSKSGISDGDNKDSRLIGTA